MLLCCLTRYRANALTRTRRSDTRSMLGADGWSWMTRTFASTPARPSSTALCRSEGTSTWWGTWTQVSGTAALSATLTASASEHQCGPCLQEHTSTTSGSSVAAPGGGTAPCPCCPPTSPSPLAPPSAWPTAGSSTSSCARERSASGCSCRQRPPCLHRSGLSARLYVCRGLWGTCGDSTPLLFGFGRLSCCRGFGAFYGNGKC